MAVPPGELVIVPDSVPLEITVNDAPLLPMPATVTVTGPVLAVAGTSAVMLPADQLETAAATPLNRTVLLPWFTPKFEPVIVTELPGPPVPGETVVILGGVGTVKVTPLLLTLPIETTTGPVAAVAGTGTVIELSLQVVGAPGAPLKVIVLVPWEAPKLLPVTVTTVLAVPKFGDSPAIVGGGPTTNGDPLLGSPLTVMTTLPVVAPAGTLAVMLPLLQLDGIPVTPLKVTVLAPCVAPKLLPLIVTVVPIEPADGETPLMAGGVATVKGTPRLAPPFAFTITLPVLAPPGTGTAMLVLLQLVGVAVTPLKVTVLVA